jgi:chaperonin GroES
MEVPGLIGIALSRSDRYLPQHAMENDMSKSSLKQQLIASLNTSGFEPLDLRVLVLPDEAKAMLGSLHLPDSVVEQDKFAQTKATLIAVGDNAWEEARARAPGFVPPVPGDRVLFGRYSGQRLKGDDGRDYIIMNDEDVIARLHKEG